MNSSLLHCFRGDPSNNAIVDVNLIPNTNSIVICFDTYFQVFDIVSGEVQYYEILHLENSATTVPKISRSAAVKNASSGCLYVLVLSSHNNLHLCKCESGIVTSAGSCNLRNLLKKWNLNQESDYQANLNTLGCVLYLQLVLIPDIPINPARVEGFVMLISTNYVMIISYPVRVT